MRRGFSGVSWTFFLSFFFGGFSLENDLNSKLCLHQGFLESDHFVGRVGLYSLW